MKKIGRRPNISKFLMCFFFLCASVVNSFAQDWRAVRDGVEYAEVIRTIDNQPVRMELLRLDLQRVRLDVVHALDAAIGTETVSSMAKRYRALAAINAGFFRLDKSQFLGDEAGLLIIDRKLLSESTNGRVVLEILNAKQKTKVAIVHDDVRVALMNGGRLVSTMAGINRERKSGEIIVYTPEFGKTTLTSDDGTEIIVHNIGRRSNGTIFEIHKSTGNSFIPKDGFVVSLTGSVGAEVVHDLTYRARRISFAPAFSSEKAEKHLLYEDMVAGVPQLIKNGKIDVTWQEEKTTKSFVETRHPRTAVAKLKDGKFLMIAVDGRSESSGGISLYDLAAYLLELGATDAMNLDGGGSTTMYLDGKLVNHPSDKEGERKVSDAIIVTLRKK